MRSALARPRRAHQGRVKQGSGRHRAGEREAISLPMLDLPGSVENQRLPNAIAVVMPLSTTARVKLDWSSDVRPARQATIHHGGPRQKSTTAETAEVRMGRRVE